MAPQSNLSDRLKAFADRFAALGRPSRPGGGYSGLAGSAGGGGGDGLGAPLVGHGSSGGGSGGGGYYHASGAAAPSRYDPPQTTTHQQQQSYGSLDVSGGGDAGAGAATHLPTQVKEFGFEFFFFVVDAMVRELSRESFWRSSLAPSSASFHLSAFANRSIASSSCLSCGTETRAREAWSAEKEKKDGLFARGIDDESFPQASHPIICSRSLSRFSAALRASSLPARALRGDGLFQTSETKKERRARTRRERSDEENKRKIHCCLLFVVPPLSTSSLSVPPSLTLKKHQTKKTKISRPRTSPSSRPSPARPRRSCGSSRPWAKRPQRAPKSPRRPGPSGRSSAASSPTSPLPTRRRWLPPWRRSRCWRRPWGSTTTAGGMQQRRRRRRQRGQQQRRRQWLLRRQRQTPSLLPLPQLRHRARRQRPAAAPIPARTPRSSASTEERARRK